MQPRLHSIILILALCLSVLPLLAQQKEFFNGHEVLSGEVLVKMQRGTTPAVMAEAFRQAGGTVRRNFTHVGWQDVQLPVGQRVSDAIGRYRQFAQVANVEPNYVYHASAMPDDPYMNQLWGLVKIGAPTAWNSATGSPNVVVAVLDTGVNYLHQDLQVNMWQNPGEISGNSVDDDKNGYVDDIYGIDVINGDSDSLDDSGHGTHVAGTIGAVGNNGLGVAGVDWSVKIMAVKFMGADGSGSLADAVTGYNYIIAEKKHGVNIRAVNDSWGGGGCSQALQDAIDAAGNLGIVSVVAAGNGSANIDASPDYPSSYSSPSLISVAASDQNDNRASFSNYGASTVDLAAPGVSILSTYNSSSMAYVTASGTSMATPYVAGSVALLAAKDPGLTAAQIKAAILNNVDKLSQWYGVVASGGRLNLARAMQSISGAVPALVVPPPTRAKIISVSLTAAPASPQKVRTPITLSASATGGAAEYTFLIGTRSIFGYWKYAALRGYGTSPIATWIPQNPGAYSLRVLARAAGSTSSYDVYTSQTYSISS